ncbi:MAG: bL35 family ribosomal protein [bacterium]|jgi:ribosomal protein L35|nr:50S ribosomal protein L35 [bacterium]
MPKLKTHSGTKDRVKISKNGKVRVGSPNRNHFLMKKSGSRKRSLRGLKTRSGKAARIIKTKLGA